MVGCRPGYIVLTGGRDALGCCLPVFVGAVAGLLGLPLLLLTSAALVWKLALPVAALLLILHLVRKQD